MASLMSSATVPVGASSQGRRALALACWEGRPRSMT